MIHGLQKHLISVSAAALCASALPVAAQQVGDYPNRPIRLVVSAAPGGSSDGAARVIAQRLNELWKQQIVVDNRGGAGGVIGAGLVAKSEPDGYTIGFVNTPNMLSIPIERPSNYTWQSFDLIGNLIDDPGAFTLNTSSPINNLKELAAYAKAHPHA